MWTPARHQATPAGLCFPTAEAWRAWLHRAHERYGELDVLTLTSCPPGVLVLFQRPGGEWLDAAVIDELLALDADRARPGLAPYNRDASRPRAVSHR